MKDSSEKKVGFILRLPQKLDDQIREIVFKKKKQIRSYSMNKYLVELIEKDMKDRESSKGGKNGKK